MQTELFLLGEHPMVDRRTHPRFVLDFRRLCQLQWQERPEFAVVIPNDHLRWLCFVGLLDEWLVVGSAEINPLCDLLDRGIRKLRLFERHVRFFGMPKQTHQMTVGCRLVDKTALHQRVS